MAAATSSLGVMFYQKWPGDHRVPAETPTAMIFQHAYEEPFPLEKAENARTCRSRC